MKYVQGDIFNTGIRNIAHGCNSAGVMGSGIAAIVRKKFPLAYADYKKHCTQPELTAYSESEFRANLLGRVFPFEENGKMIFNMITQGDWSRAFGTDHRYASYDAISECFQEANRHQSCLEHGLAIPLIGAGLGGGNWRVIERIIEEETPDIDVTIYKL